MSQRRKKKTLIPQVGKGKDDIATVELLFLLLALLLPIILISKLA